MPGWRRGRGGRIKEKIWSGAGGLTGWAHEITVSPYECRNSRGRRAPDGIVCDDQGAIESVAVCAFPDCDNQRARLRGSYGRPHGSPAKTTDGLHCRRWWWAGGHSYAARFGDRVAPSSSRQGGVIGRFVPMPAHPKGATTPCEDTGDRGHPLLTRFAARPVTGGNKVHRWRETCRSHSFSEAVRQPSCHNSFWALPSDQTRSA